MDEYNYGLHSKTDERKKEARKVLLDLFKNRPVPDDHLMVNTGLYTRSSALAKILFLDEIYKKILRVPGKIMVFGLWWGQDVIVLENLRAIHEPYNHARKIIGFDTFEGYPKEDIGKQDKISKVITGGGYSVAENYYEYLLKLASYHEEENAMSNIKKVELIKGDVLNTVPQYFENNPETIVSLAYFDLALYEPTKVCLERVINSCIKGSIIVFDELNDSDYPGETIALKELVNIRDISIERSEILPDRTIWRL